jgi:hypothetical protein
VARTTKVIAMDKEISEIEERRNNELRGLDPHDQELVNMFKNGL